MTALNRLLASWTNDLREALKASPVARGLVRQVRLRTGQPKWEGLARDPAWMETVARAAGSDRRVLVATSMGGYIGGSRMESLLAAALTVRGAAVDVLLCDRLLPACQLCTQDWYPDEAAFAEGGPSSLHCRACYFPGLAMYRRLGVAVRSYGEHLTPDERREAARIAASVPYDEIRDFKLDGLAVGEHAVAGALRFYARATLETQQHAERVVRRYLEAALLTTFAMQALLSAKRYDVAVFHHGIYVPQGLVGEVARRSGVRVVNWHTAYRKKSFIFSHGDTYHHTLMTEPTSTWEDLPWTRETETALLDYLKSRWKGSNDWITFHRQPQFELDEIAKEIGVDFSKPCIGMLTNVMWDAQLHYPANAFPSMLDWTLETIAYFATRPDLQLLIRVHPAEITGRIPSLQPIVDEIRKVFPTLPPNVFVIPPESRISTYVAMLKCDSVLIYGTKTGVELTSLGIPVLVAGEAWIRGKGITLDATSREDYFRLLEGLPLGRPLDEERVRRARKYAYHFFFRRMIPIELTRVTGGEPGFEFPIGSQDDLAVGRDTGLDTICDGILRGTEFVHRAEFAAEKGLEAGACPS